MTQRVAFQLAVLGAIMLAVRIAGYPLRFDMHMTVGALSCSRRGLPRRALADSVVGVWAIGELLHSNELDKVDDRLFATVI